MYDFILFHTITFSYQNVGVIRRTIRGLQQLIGVLEKLDMGVEEFGQMAVPSVCHLQYEQKKWTP